MKLKIYFSNNQDKVKISPFIKFKLKKAVKRTLINENFEKDAEVSVSFVNDNEIKLLNSEFRGKDKPTDVLSFPMSECDEENELDIVTGRYMLGDIVISAERALAQAREYGHSLKREICFLAVHSTLHLLGYDHETSAVDEIYMNDTQEKILTSIHLTRSHLS